MASDRDVQVLEQRLNTCNEVMTFLRERMEEQRLRGSGDGRWTGQSSDALVEIALHEVMHGRGDTDVPSPESTYRGPSDLSDMAACIRACDRAPKAMQPAMWRVLWVWWNQSWSRT